MKKGVIITILVVVGLVVAGGLVASAVLELIQAVIGFVVWSIILLAGYFFIKSKVD
ncbi:hypothetical protein KUV50_15265 [Membranicola marinus]|uniref:Uncharacterized protein n=1 Tax=Membranihabitans marinus TaxID=1227546 RepID=A0A953HW04_9BACT|nr:hypothetical protein [Membranihabitans marinus]MBY5959510.1 hypothetical protein [Membranihabitans marinus]